MEESLLNEWLCNKIIEQSNDAVMFSDREGIIRLWNTGSERMFGYSARRRWDSPWT